MVQTLIITLTTEKFLEEETVLKEVRKILADGSVNLFKWSRKRKRMCSSNLRHKSKQKEWLI